MTMTKEFSVRSIIKEFPLELLAKIDFYMDIESDNNAKQNKCFELFKEYDFSVISLGCGTNRCAFKYKGYVIKVAMDYQGKENNLIELKYSPKLYPGAIKVYEGDTFGLISVCEYVSLYSSFNSMMLHKEKVLEVLSKLCANYYIADIGLVAINVNNWGYRNNDPDSPVCLDFGYMFPLDDSTFRCPHCDGRLDYQSDYHKLTCRLCKASLTFTKIARSIPNDILKKALDFSDLENYIEIKQCHEMMRISEDKWPKSMGKIKKKPNKKKYSW